MVAIEQEVYARHSVEQLSSIVESSAQVIGK